jgi:S1-C subfamily serine protease
VVIKLGEFDVSDMMAYMKALASFKKGDKTTVVVNRGGKEVKRKLQF